MPRRGKLNDHADWLILRSNQDTRTIANAYKETFGTSVSHVAVANWFKKNVTPKVNEELQKRTSKLAIKTAQEAMDYIVNGLEYLETKEGLERSEFFLIEQKGKMFDRLMKLMALYQPEYQTNIAIAIVQSKAEATRELIESLPPDLQASVRAFLGQ